MSHAPSPPQRLVSLVPSTTESLCAFGAGPRLVGCTRYCTHPPGALAHAARIGGTKNPDREAILRLQPDLVLANGEENRAEDLAWLTSRVPVLTQTPRTVAAAVAALHELAVALGCAAAAGNWTRGIEAWLAERAAAAPAPHGRRVYYAIWRKPWMSVNRDTFVHDVLACLGLENVCADEAARYPEVSPDVAVERGTDCVLLASEPWAFDEGQRQELAASRAFGPARLVLCDGRDFCWHGVHMASGLPRAAALLAGR